MENYLLKTAAFGLVFTALTLYSCQRESVDSSGNSTEILGKARQDFESSYISGTKLKAEIAARNIHPDDPQERVFFEGYKLDPINFAPEWDKAQVNSKYNEIVVDVPIAPEYYFKAFFTSTEPGSQEYGSLVTQRLTIAFGEDGKADGVYGIASIIPDPEYFYTHLAIARECNIGGDMGSFTGIVLFHNLAGELQKMERYDGGTRSKCITRESFGTDIDGFASAVVPFTVAFVMGRSIETLQGRSVNADNEGNTDREYGRAMRPHEVDKLMRDIANRSEYIYFDSYGGGPTSYANVQYNGQTINIRHISIGMIETNGYRVCGTPYNADHKDFGNGEWRTVYKFAAPGGVGFEMWISINDDQAKKLPTNHPFYRQ